MSKDGNSVMATTRLRQIAYARSGDKGRSANIGVIAYTPTGYDILQNHLSADLVEAYFKPMGVQDVTRYELPNLGALNFILHGILDGGGSLNPRIDAQGKALGQTLLELELELPDGLISQCLPPQVQKEGVDE